MPIEQIAAELQRHIDYLERTLTVTIDGKTYEIQEVRPMSDTKIDLVVKQ